MNLLQSYRHKVARILIMTAFLLAASPLFVVSPAQATLATNASDTMTRQKVSTSSQHAIALTLSGAQTFATAETIIYTWGAGFTFPANSTTWTTADFAFNDGTARTITSVGTAPTCNAGTNNVSVTIDHTTRRLTVTACGSYVASSAGATVTFTVAENSGITNRTILNGASAGSQTITVGGTFGDDSFVIAVPLMDDDQVSVTATVNGYITFDLDIGDGSHGETSTPYNIALGTLAFSAATTDATSGISEIYFNLDSNAKNGAVVQVKSANAALSSASTSDSIPSTTAGGGMTLNSTNGNYGLAGAQTTAATEGALTPVSPFNVFGTPTAVGAVTTGFQTVFNTGAAPIIDGDGKIGVRAVAGKSTSAATDYTDTLTFRATATY